MNSMNHVLGRFPGQTPPFVREAEGCYLILEDGRRLLDATAGYSACVSVGYSHPEVISAMKAQLDKCMYLPGHVWSTPQAGELAEVLLSTAPDELDRVYYSGTSGSDSLEAAMKLSYQVHVNEGKPEKSWFICRDEAYHGATLHALAITNVDIWDFYDPLLPKNIAKIPQHNAYGAVATGGTVHDCVERDVSELEQKILELGPKNVGAFVAETMLGQLVGNVPPAPGYWKKIREVCDRYDVHIILDEVYCGLGRSGKVHCFSWDDFTPDFVCEGKMLAAGYSPISAVLTRSKFEKVIREGHGRVMYAHTYQGHPVGLAAALAVQKIIHRRETLEHIEKLSHHIRARLEAELGSHPFFGNIRGRGLLITLEYQCKAKHEFGSFIENRMLEQHGIIVNSRWHRSSFTPPSVMTIEEADQMISAYIECFHEASKTFPDL